MQFLWPCNLINKGVNIFLYLTYGTTNATITAA